jgi:hypothetical protein
MNMPSLVGVRYVFDFIDELSRYTWVYFLKNKEHVFEKFREIGTFYRKKCGHFAKFLRSVNG